MWAAIIGSLVLLVGTGAGVIFWAHISNATEQAKAAHFRAHENEKAHLEQRANHVEEMRKLEGMMLRQEIATLEGFVRKADHDAVTSEIFRKLEAQDRQTVSAFTELRTWLNSKFDSLATQLNTKQDKHL